jgi:peptidoglycan-associated lipoprotein
MRPLLLCAPAASDPFDPTHLFTQDHAHAARFAPEESHDMNHSTTTTTRKAVWAAVALVSAWGLVGCGSTVKLDDKPGGAPVETRSATSASTLANGASANGGTVTQPPVATVDLTANRPDADALAAAGRVVYFDYDSFVVKDDFRPLIVANAKALSADRTQRLALEGHTDERGGREYNLALGQKRAEAVAKALALLGANESQLEAVSFGKERLAATGNDEAAWAKNRRVELSKR